MTSSISFLHAADIHLDDQPIGINREYVSNERKLRIVNASRDAFEFLVQTAIEKKVNFLLLAGDIFDNGIVDFQTRLWFIEQLKRLAKVSIPVYIAWGNHDANWQIAGIRTRDLPSNVHVFGDESAETSELPECNVAIHGQSHSSASDTRSLASSFPNPIEGRLNVGLLHTNVEGRGGHRNYVPSKLDVLKGSGYDYWALGHVHKTEILCTDPYVVYPGNLQGRHINEQGKKGAYLVAAENSYIENVEFLPCSQFDWQQLDVDLSAATELSDIDELVTDEVRRICLPPREYYVRVRLIGDSLLHRQLNADVSSAQHDVVEAIEREPSLEHVVVAEVRVDTKEVVSESPINVNKVIEAVRDTGLDSLLSLEVEAEDRLDLSQWLHSELEPFMSKIPKEIKNTNKPSLLKSLQGSTDDLIEEIALALKSHVPFDGS